MSKTLNKLLEHWTAKPNAEGVVEVPFDIESFCAEMDSERERLEAQNAALVEALPKTKDGVTVLPGMELFLKSGMSVGVLSGYTLAKGQDPSNWPVAPPGYRVKDCYSSKEAALKAAGVG